MGGDADKKRKRANATKLVDGKEPRIRLEPTPGRLQKGKFAEVLTSGPGSDYYVTDITRVPKTRFFRILRDANCDQTVYTPILTEKRLAANPAIVGSGKYRDEELLYQCEVAFHNRFKRGEEELAGADGVIFDGMQQYEDVTNPGVPFTLSAKAFIRGYAIQFVEPTPEDLKRRLSTPAYERIDVLQLETATWWIYKHKAVEYRPQMRAMLPKEGTSRSKPGWNGRDLAMLQGLVLLGDDPANHPILLGILRDGIDNSPRANPRMPISPPGNSAAGAELAANALGCAKDPRDADELFRVAMKSDFTAYKLVSLKALLTMGRHDLIEKVLGNIDDLGTVAFFNFSVGKRGIPFDCPMKWAADDV